MNGNSWETSLHTGEKKIIIKQFSCWGCRFATSCRPKFTEHSPCKIISVKIKCSLNMSFWRGLYFMWLLSPSRAQKGRRSSLLNTAISTEKCTLRKENCKIFSHLLPFFPKKGFCFLEAVAYTCQILGKTVFYLHKHEYLGRGGEESLGKLLFTGDWVLQKSSVPTLGMADSQAKRPFNKNIHAFMP